MQKTSGNIGARVTILGLGLNEFIVSARERLVGDAPDCAPREHPRVMGLGAHRSVAVVAYNIARIRPSPQLTAVNP
jgi:hypothetical protein